MEPDVNNETETGLMAQETFAADSEAILFRGEYINLCGCDSIAERTITNVRFEFDNSTGLTVVLEKISRRMLVSWPEELMQKAVFFNIVPYIEKTGPHLLVTPNVDTIEVSIPVRQTMPATEWEGYAEARDTITYVLKNNKKKGEGVRNSRIERINTLIQKINTAAIDIITSEKRYNTLRNSSPVPHGATGEMTLGSTAEINEQQKRIVELRDQINSHCAEIERHVSKINEVLLPKDEGWSVQLPETIDVITRSNTDFYNPKK